MKLSLFFVSYVGVWGQHKLDMVQLIRKAAELGYDAVMMTGKRPHLSPLDVAERIEQLQVAFREHAIECAAVGAYVDFASIGAAEVPFVKMQLHYVELLAQIASQLGARIAGVFSGYEQPGVNIHTSSQQVVQALKILRSCRRIRHGSRYSKSL